MDNDPESQPMRPYMPGHRPETTEGMAPLPPAPPLPPIGAPADGPPVLPSLPDASWRGVPTPPLDLPTEPPPVPATRRMHVVQPARGVDADAINEAYAKSGMLPPAPPSSVPVVAVGLVIVLALGGGIVALNRFVKQTQQPTAAVTPADLANGALTIQSQPAGAVVVVDGMVKGKTPLELKDLPPNIYAVDIRKVGFETLHRQVGVDTGQGHTEMFRLFHPATLVLQHLPNGAHVFLDGVSIRVNPQHVPPGRHELVVRAAGYVDYSHTIKLAGGQTLKFSPALAHFHHPSASASAATAPAPAANSVVVMPAPCGANRGGDSAPAPPTWPANPQPPSRPVGEQSPAPEQPHAACGVVVHENPDMVQPTPTETNKIPGL